MTLSQKAFDILRFLVERADRLVTLDEILEALEPGTYVNPEGIRKYILEIGAGRPAQTSVIYRDANEAVLSVHR